MSSKKTSKQFINRNVTYSKDNEDVVRRSKQSHQEFIDAMRVLMDKSGVSLRNLSTGVGVDQPQAYRLFDPNSNVTITTMNRFASVLGKRVKLSLVDDK